MSQKISRWFDDIESMKYSEIWKYKEALETLVGWELFWSEYKDTGLQFFLGHMKYKLKEVDKQ